MKSVLIVDDSSYYRSRGAEIVSRAGYKCHFAENGEQAVRMYHRIQPDIVTMDICMPLMDGLEATKQNFVLVILMQIYLFVVVWVMYQYIDARRMITELKVFYQKNMIQMSQNLL